MERIIESRWKSMNDEEKKALLGIEKKQTKSLAETIDWTKKGCLDLIKPKQP
ncbi:MAG: hypothetical protein ACI9EW_001304 [Cellvibrionaceae bacterium]|jgi:hypothetical protein